MYPSDIFPESGSRLPLPKREDLDAEGQKLFDVIANVGGVILRGLRGPSGIHLHSPPLAHLLRPLNTYLRSQTGFSGRIREIAILTTARACDSQFEWVPHEQQAIKEGVPDTVIDIIKHRRPTAGLDAGDALVIDLCRAAFVSRHVGSELYARALAQFGERQLVDLAVLMGYYAMTAAMLTIFDMQLDPGQEPMLPMP